MIYTVVRHFTDLLDGNHRYAEGDVYPRTGYTPSEKRIAELSSADNKQKTVLIQAVVEVDETESAEIVETSAVEETEPTVVTEEIKVTETEKPKKRSRKKSEE